MSEVSTTDYRVVIVFQLFDGMSERPNEPQEEFSRDTSIPIPTSVSSQEDLRSLLFGDDDEEEDTADYLDYNDTANALGSLINTVKRDVERSEYDNMHPYHSHGEHRITIIPSYERKEIIAKNKYNTISNNNSNSSKNI